MKTRFAFTLFLLAMMPMSCTAQQLPQSKSEMFSAAFLEFVTKSLEDDNLPQSVAKSMVERQEIKPQVVVHNRTSVSSIRIEPNHIDRIYEEDDRVILKVTSNVSGYPYLVNQRPDGTFHVLYPYESDIHGQVKAGETFFYPPKDATWEIIARTNFGVEKFIAFVSKQKLDVKQLESPKFYEQRGLLKGEDSKDMDRVEIAADDLPCQTITVHTYAKGQRPPSRPKQRFVLLVSGDINQQNPSKNLPACLNDVKLLAWVFAKYGQVDAIDLLSGKDMTKKNVRKAFDALVKKSRPGDEIFIVWTGHGDQMSDTTGLQPTGYTQYLVFYDSKQNDPTSVLTDMEFEHWLDDLDGCRIALFFDTCHSGGMIDASIKSGDVKEYNFLANKFVRQLELEGVKDIRPDQAVVLCSSTVGQASLVIRGEIPFSAMILCMAKCVFDSDKAVSFDDICKFAEVNVPPLVKAKTGRTQTPVYMNQIGKIYIKP